MSEPMIHRVAYKVEELVIDPMFDVVLRSDNVERMGIWTLFKSFEAEMVDGGWILNHHDFMIKSDRSCRWDQIVFSTEGMLNMEVEESHRELLRGSVMLLWQHHLDNGMAEFLIPEVAFYWSGREFGWLTISIFTET